MEDLTPQEQLAAYARDNHTHAEVLARRKELRLPSTAVTPIIEEQGGYRLRCEQCQKLFTHSTSRRRSYCSRDCQTTAAASKPRKPNRERTPEEKAARNARYRATMQEKYGVDNIFQREETKEQSRQTNLRKYGVEHSMQSADIRARARATNLERYGAEVSSQSDEVKARARATMEARYGAVSPILNPEIRARADRAMEVRRRERLDKARSELDSVRGDSETITFAEAYRTLGLSKSRTWVTLQELGYEKFIQWNMSIVNSEWEDILSKRFPGVNMQREVGIFSNARERADFAFPDIKVALDINPTITHSTQETPALKFFKDRGGLSTKHHQKRALDARQNGWRLIQVFDWNDPEKILQILEHAISQTPATAYARQCDIVEIAPEQSAEFLDCYHLQGNAQSSVRYALKYGEEIVAVMTFSKERFRRDKNNVEAWELIRFATKGSVPGAASRLFKHFTRTYTEVSTVKTFADLSIGHGTVYPLLGFAEVGLAGLNAYYAKPGTTEAYKTTTLSQGKIRRLFPDAPVGASQKEIMNSHGYYRINDAGNMIYMWERE